MIHLALLRKNVRDSALLWGGCAIALFAISWIRVWFVSRVEMSRFQQIIELLPNDWRRFSSVDFEWLITYTGRISLVFDEPGIVLCMSIWAIARGSDVVSGELNRGTMEMLLAQPVSRMQIFFTHGLVTTIGTLLLAGLTLAGTTCGIESFSVKEKRTVSLVPLPIQLPFPMPFDREEEVSIPLRDEVDPTVYFVGARNFAALGFMLAGVSAGVSAFDRYRWRTLGIVVSAYLVSLMLKTFGLASETTEWLGYFSVFSAYEPKLLVKIVSDAPQFLWALRVDSSFDGTNGLGPLGFDAILLSIGLAGYIMGAWRFGVRDLPAPM